MTIMNNNNNNNDDDHHHEHDQLPSVEEYKSTMADPRSHRIDPKRIMEAVMGSDSDDDDDLDGNIHYLEEGVDDGKDEVYNDNDGQDYYMNEEDEQEIFHDQLPSVDEIHAQRQHSNSSSSTKCLLRCGYTVLVILFLLVIILPPVLLTRKNDYEQRKNRIIQTLLMNGIVIIDDDDTSVLLEDVSTPQGKAVEFLATEQYFDDEILWKENGTKLIERYTAVVFYYSTGGPNWKYKLYFLSSTRDVCDWNAYFQSSGSGEIVQEGIICDDDDGDGDSEDDDDKVVRTLYISNNNLVGSLPSELKSWTGLEQLHLPFNPSLSGSLPDTMATLTKLSSIELHYCSLIGTIPIWLGQNLPIRRLALANNLFDGTIPSELYQATDLVILALDDNGLKANIEDFGNFKRLQLLYLEDNEIDGVLTNLLLDQWKLLLKELDVSGNSIQGELPTELFQKMTSLEILDLHGNEIGGTIPDTINGNNRLDFLALHDNKLTGTIPQNISLLNDLQHLDLSRNDLSGTIPTEIGKLKFLRYLFLGSNNYNNEQTIPTEIWSLTSLQELSLKSSKLIGTISSEIINLKDLVLLDLDGNQLQGTIPNEIGSTPALTNLAHVLLNRNELTGTIPSSFSNLKSLELLLLDHNKLTGTANPICDFHKLRYFVSDCEPPSSSSTTAEISCSCCDLCCNDFNQTCNIYDWNVNLDPIWEYGYERKVFTFTQDVIQQGGGDGDDGGGGNGGGDKKNNNPDRRN